MTNTINVGLVGAGYWGKKLLPKFLAAPNCSVKMVCDLHADLCSSVRQNYPGVGTTDSYEKMLNDPEIGAVVLATPPATHFALAKKAIEAGKHVWVEKPLSTSFEEGSLLVGLAQERRIVLFVDHTFLYDPFVRAIRDLIKKGELGDIYHAFFQRLNLGRIKRDSNVWWNSAPHDVSLLLYLLESQPASVTLHGYHYLQDGIEDLNMAAIEMADGTSAFIYHNWLYPENTAKLTIIGSKKLLMYEGKFARREVSVCEYAVEKDGGEGPEFPTTIPSRIVRQYRLEDIRDEEPLALAISDFLGGIRQGCPPLSDGNFSLKVLAVLEAGEDSLRSGGGKILIKT